MERIFPYKGGYRKPWKTREFILGYIASHGEACPAEIHRALKEEIASLEPPGPRGGKRRYYRRPVYHSIENQVQKLARENLIKFSGREEPTEGLHGQFKGFKELPVLRYYALT